MTRIRPLIDEFEGQLAHSIVQLYVKSVTWVVDTSVLVAVLANEPVKPAVIRLTRGLDLIAPASVHWEIGNAFAAGLKRGRFSFAEVRTALSSYGTVTIRFMDVELESALWIADRLQIYAYDAYVLACAQAQSCPILSLDRGLVAAANRLGLSCIEVSV